MAAQTLCIRRVPLDDVCALDDAGHKLYNDSNHWDDGGVRPADYDVASAACNTSAWLPHVPRRHVKLHLSGVQWLDDAQKLWLAGTSSSRRPISALFDDEVAALVEKHADAFTEPWFVRAENVSLKYGTHGCGPYTDLRAVLESVVSAPLDHSPLQSLVHGRLLLYLFPWVELDKSREFRVFVHNGRVCAMSQQFLYQCFDGLDDATTLVRFADAVIETCARMAAFLPSYVADVAVLADGSGYFIEANPFGAQYSSGSALFHWVRDADILLGREGEDALWVAVTVP